MKIFKGNKLPKLTQEEMNRPVTIKGTETVAKFC